VEEDGIDIDFIKKCVEKAEGFGIVEEDGIDIDFIKKCVEKAEGFIFRKGYKDHNFLITPLKHLINLDNLTPDHPNILKWTREYFPLLLQRAIEGVNNLHLNDDKYPTILFDCYEIEIRYNKTEWKDKSFHFDMFDSIDQAKESALKYVFKDSLSISYRGI